MKIKIKDNASALYISNINCGNELFYNDKWYKILKAIEGKEIEIETEYLFKDQFNTIPIKDISENGIRIMMRYVDYVIDDIRYNKMKCRYCGTTQDISEKCIKCNDNKYIEKFDTIMLDYQNKRY